MKEKQDVHDRKRQDLKDDEKHKGIKKIKTQSAKDAKKKVEHKGTKTQRKSTRYEGQGQNRICRICKS